jgi:hypothetical protein
MCLVVGVAGNTFYKSIGLFFVEGKVWHMLVELFVLGGWRVDHLGSESPRKVRVASRRSFCVEIFCRGGGVSIGCGTAVLGVAVASIGIILLLSLPVGLVDSWGACDNSGGGGGNGRQEVG